MAYFDQQLNQDAEEHLMTETREELPAETVQFPMPTMSDLGAYGPGLVTMLLVVWFVREFRLLIEACGKL